MALLDTLADFPALFLGSVLLLGLLVGSFLNVVIYRLPIMLERQWREECEQLAREQADAVPTDAVPTDAVPPGASHVAAERFNLVVPRSACPHCGAPIRPWQNIPVVSYLALRGRCARCAAPISARYPAIELATGLASAVVAWRFGFGWPAAAALVLTWFLIALTMIDLDHQLLPDQLTLPLMWIGLLLSLAAPAPGGASVPVDLRSSVIGAAAGYLSLWSVYHLFRLITGKEGMGYGDFKLLAALGAWLGWQMLLPVVLVAAAVGALVGLILLATRRKDRGTPIAFGPFLAAAGWLMLLFGQRLVGAYLAWFPRTH
jgi:leader peptidase (prepilin peptidase) / N-methyltransferase